MTISILERTEKTIGRRYLYSNGERKAMLKRLFIAIIMTFALKLFMPVRLSANTQMTFRSELDATLLNVIQRL